MKLASLALLIAVGLLGREASAAGLNAFASPQGGPLQYDAGSATGPVDRSATYIATGVNYNFATHVAFGSLGTSIDGTRSAGSLGPDSGISKGLIDDTLTFGSGSGTFKVHMDLEGELEINGATFTTAGIRLELRYGSFLTSALLFEKTLSPNTAAGNLIHINQHFVSSPIPFVAGAEIRMITDLLATVTVQGFDPVCMARSDFLDTAHVAYLEVRDGNGNLINPTAVSQSGFAYAINAVPEPASLLSLGSAGAVLLLTRRQHRARAHN